MPRQVLKGKQFQRNGNGAGDKSHAQSGQQNGGRQQRAACMCPAHWHDHHGRDGGAQGCRDAHRQMAHTLAKDDVAAPARTAQCSPRHARRVECAHVVSQRQQQCKPSDGQSNPYKVQRAAR